MPITKTSLPPVLRQFLAWTAVLASIAFATKCICQWLLHLPAAYDYMIFPTSFLGVDFNCFRGRFEHFHHASFFGPNSSLVFTYPAPAAVVYQFFYLPPEPVVVYSLFFAACIGIVGYHFSGVLERYGVQRKQALIFLAVTALCSDAFICQFFLANLEIVLGFVIGFGLYFFLKNKPWASATCFAVAGSMKLFPFIFLALLLTQKKYKQIAYALVLAVVIYIASCWLLSGSVATSWHGTQAGLDFYRQNYALSFNSWDTGVDHSIWGLIKGTIVLAGFHYPTNSTMAPIMRMYMAVTTVIGLLLYFLRIRFLPVLNQVLTICIISILLTPSSKDYTLMHLYVPWAMLVLLAVQAHRQHREIQGLKAAFVCLALLLAPISEIIARGNVLSGQIKSVQLIALLIIGLRFPFTTPEEATSAAPMRA